MKKTYDYDVAIKFYLADTKQTVNMLLSIHTSFKEISLRLADLMGMDVFSTEFNYYVPDQAYAANVEHAIAQLIFYQPASNLKQNQVMSGQTITVKLVATQGGYPTASHYLQKARLIDHEEMHLYEPRTKQPTYGLVVEGICSNQKCLNYCKSITIPLGYGEFGLN